MTYCHRCEKQVTTHTWSGRLYGVSMMPQKVCDECGYTIAKEGKQ